MVGGPAVFYGIASGTSADYAVDTRPLAVPGRPPSWRRRRSCYRHVFERLHIMLRMFWERSIRRLTRARRQTQKPVWHRRISLRLETLSDRIMPSVSAVFSPTAHACSRCSATGRITRSRSAGTPPGQSSSTAERCVSRRLADRREHEPDPGRSARPATTPFPWTKPTACCRPLTFSAATATTR